MTAALLDRAVTPSTLWVPPGRAGSMLDDVIAMGELIGRPLDATQRLVVDALESHDDAGRWLTLEALIVMGRQSGKTGGIGIPICLTHCLLDEDDPDRVVWTAHRLKTSTDAFNDVKAIIKRTPEIRARVVRISEKDGEEGVEFDNGTSLEFIARSEAAGRGLGGRTVFLDEWLFGTEGIAGALLPIMAARPNPRVYYLSSAPKKVSSHLRRLIRRARAGGDPTLIAAEFAAAGSWKEPGCAIEGCDHVFEPSEQHRAAKGCALDDEQLWLQANPGLASGRISIGFMRSMRRSLAWLEFGREFLGWGEDGDGTDETIDPAVWDALVDPVSRVRKRSHPVFGVTVRADQSSAAVSVSGHRDDGLVHVGLARRAVPIDEVVDELARLNRKHQPRLVVLAPGPATKRLRPALERAGVRVRVANEAELAQAAATILASTKAKDLRHRGDPVVRSSLEAAKPRQTTDGGWTVDLRGDGDSAPFVSVLLARWGVAIGPRVLSDDELRDSLG